MEKVNFNDNRIIHYQLILFILTLGLELTWCYSTELLFCFFLFLFRVFLKIIDKKNKNDQEYAIFILDFLIDSFLLFYDFLKFSNIIVISPFSLFYNLLILTEIILIQRKIFNLLINGSSMFKISFLSYFYFKGIIEWKKLISLISYILIFYVFQISSISSFDDNIKLDILNNMNGGILIIGKINGKISKNSDIMYMNNSAKELFELKEFKNFKIEKIKTNMIMYMDSSQSSNMYSDLINNNLGNKYKNKNIIIIVKNQEYCQGKNKFVALFIDYINEKQVIKDIFRDLKCQIFHTISHELNNPINGLVNCLKETHFDKEESKKNIKKIQIFKILIKIFLKNLSLFKYLIDKESIESHPININFDYYFMKINNKLKSLFESKSIELRIMTTKEIKDIIIFYDYNEFKNLIQNIYMLIYYELEKNSKVYINYKIVEKTLFVNFIYIPSSKKFKEVTNHSFSIKTIDMLKEIIINLAESMKIPVNFNITSKIDFEISLELKVFLIDESKDDSLLLLESSSCKNSGSNINQIFHSIKKNSSVLSSSSNGRINSLEEFSPNDNKFKKKLSKFSSKKIEIYAENCSKANLDEKRELSKDQNIFNMIEHSLEEKLDKKKVRMKKSKKNTLQLDNISEIINDRNNQINTFSFNEFIEFDLKCLSAENEKIDFNLSNLEENQNCNCNDILIVDDEDFNVSSIKNLIKNYNLESDSCSDGEQCIEKILKENKKQCCQKRYKLILMDIIMPNMGGIECCLEIKKLIDKKMLDFSPNIIIISALEKNSIINKIKNIEFIKDYISKPVKKCNIERILNLFYF